MASQNHRKIIFLQIYSFKGSNKVEKNYQFKGLFSFLYYRRITKMDKITGSKVQFMLDYPEFGRLYSLDIYADDHEIQDGKSNEK